MDSINEIYRHAFVWEDNGCKVKYTKAENEKLNPGFMRLDKKAGVDKVSPFNTSKVILEQFECGVLLRDPERPAACFNCELDFKEKTKYQDLPSSGHKVKLSSFSQFETALWVVN